MVDHDVNPGELSRCQVCGSSDLELVLDVGHQPLCDSLLTTEQLKEPEVTYPLRLFRCTKCTLTQLDYVVDGSVVYAPDYPYRSGITKELAVYQQQFADGVVSDGYKRYEKWLNDMKLEEDHLRNLFIECVIASPSWIMYKSLLNSSTNPSP